MTKTVALVRHAKSDWGSAELRDKDRPLAPRGRKDAPKIGAWLDQQQNWELALVSPALRARETFDALHIETPKHIDEHLYPTQAGHILRRLKGLDESVSHVVIVGHNPGISQAATTLLAQLDDDPKLEDFPTSTVAILQFNVENWTELDFSTGVLKAFMTPKRLKGK